jgi:hypothetical protein
MVMASNTTTINATPTPTFHLPRAFLSRAALSPTARLCRSLNEMGSSAMGPRKFGQLRRLLTQLYTITTPTNDPA